MWWGVLAKWIRRVCACWVILDMTDKQPFFTYHYSNCITPNRFLILKCNNLIPNNTILVSSGGTGIDQTDFPSQFISENSQRLLPITRLKTIRLMQYWYEQDCWPMFCSPHCSESLSTLNNIVTPDSVSTILFNFGNSTTVFNTVQPRAQGF